MNSPISDNIRSRHNLSTILKTINKRKYQNQKRVFSYQFSPYLPGENIEKSIQSSGSRQLLNQVKKYKSNLQSTNRSLLLNGRYRTLENRDSNYYLRKIKEVEKNNKINCELQQLCQGKNEFMPLEKLEDRRRVESTSTDMKKTSNHMIIERLKKYIQQKQKIMQLKKMEKIQEHSGNEEQQPSTETKERKKSNMIEIFQFNNVLKCRRAEAPDKPLAENQHIGNGNEAMTEKQKPNFPPIETKIKKILLLPKNQKHSTPFVNSVGKSQADGKFKGPNFSKNSAVPIKNQNILFRDSINMWSSENTLVDPENPSFDFLNDYI